MSDSGIPVADPIVPGLETPNRKSSGPWRQIVAAVLGIAILVVLISVVGGRRVLDVFQTADRLWLSLALISFLPQFFVIGWRWMRMSRVFVPISLAEGIKQTLATNTANVVLPSKLGDFGKGLILARSGKVSMAGAMGLVALEKLMDVGVLALYMILGTGWLLLTGGDGLSPVHRGGAYGACVVGLGALGAIAGLYLLPVPAGAGEGVTGFRGKVLRIAGGIKDGLRALRAHGASVSVLLGSTLLIWALHLIQIWLFFQAVGAHPDLARFLCLAPLSIFIGLIPLTFGGFGTRDAALIGLFAPIPEPIMLAAALLVNSRYLVPALLGWPFFHRFAARG